MFKFKLSQDEDKLEKMDLPEVTPLVDVNGKAIYIDVVLKINTLQLFCAYSMILDNQLISRNAMRNMLNFTRILDKARYSTNDTLLARIEFVKLAMTARVELELDDEELIYDYIMKNLGKFTTVVANDVIPTIKAEKDSISNNTIKYVNSTISKEITYGFSVMYTRKLLDMLSSRDDENHRYSDEKDYATAISSIANEISENMKQAATTERNYQKFDQSEECFNEVIKASVTNLKKPGNKLRTGMKKLNKMLNGGYEGSRVYIFGGVTGIGKSVILQSMADQIKKYNKAVTKDKDKRGVILLLSQENHMDECIERQFNMTVTNEDIRMFTPDEVGYLLKTKGGLELKSKDDIELVMQYHPDKSISSEDIMLIIDELEKDGKEVICVVQDYIQRLKCTTKTSELRHELGALANDLENVAKKYNIPVITACQLSKAADTIVENAKMHSEADAGKFLGKSTAAESWQMINNVDVFIAINKEYDLREPEMPITYMSFNLGKFRGRPNEERVYYFVHPFERENDLALIHDINRDKSVSCNSMKEILSGNPLLSPPTVKQQTPVMSVMPMYDPYNDFNSFQSFSTLPQMPTDKASMLKAEFDKLSKENESNINKNKNLLISGRDTCKYDIDKNGYIRVKSKRKKKENKIDIPTKDGLFVIASRKNKKKTSDGRFVIGARGKK